MERREPALGRLAASSAIKALQSRSVLGRRGESPGVRGDGELGREPDTEPEMEPLLDAVGELSALRFVRNSALARFDRWRPDGSVALTALVLLMTLPVGETARDE